MRNLNFKLWEIILILFSIVLFSFSYLIFSTDFPLVKNLMGVSEDDKQILIGHVVSKEGSVKRRKANQTDFSTIDSLSPLYNQDMIVTGPESSASIYFEGGSAAELGAHTMIRLAFKTDVALGGITRQAATRLDVVAGKVTGQAGKQKLVIASAHQEITVAANSAKRVDIPNVAIKPMMKATPIITEDVAVKPIQPPPPEVLAAIRATPSPTPTPTPSPTEVMIKRDITKIKVISPRQGEKFNLEPTAKDLQKPVTLVWGMSPADGDTQVVIRKLANDDKLMKGAGSEVFNGKAKAKEGTGSLVFVIDAPGRYEWEIKGPKGERLAAPEATTGYFKMDPIFEGIKTLNPLVGGKPMTSNQLTEEVMNHFEITLRWEKHPLASEYNLVFTKTGDSKKPFLEKNTKKPEFSFSQGKAFSGKFYYTISSTLKNDFMITSGLQSFSFAFLPPLPVVPKMDAIISQAMLKQENNHLILTWQKTNFTDSYELEMSQNAQFKSPKIQTTTEENFYTFENPDPGKYWWRVRSVSKELSSVMSKPSTFTIENKTGSTATDE